MEDNRAELPAAVEMNAAPLIISDKSVNDLIRTRNFLAGQKHELCVTLETEEQDVSEGDDLEELQRRISQLQINLLQVSANQSVKEMLLKSMQCGQVLSDKLFGEPLPVRNVPDGSTDVLEQGRGKFEALVQEQCSLSKTILRKHEKVEELQKELDGLRKKNFELKKRNRILMGVIAEHRKRLEETVEDVKNDPSCIRLKEQLENTVARADIAKCVLQALIVGSGVNWAQDPELVDTVFLCGESQNP